MSAATKLRRLVTSAPIVWVDAARSSVLAALVEVGLRTTSVSRLARMLGVRLVLDGKPALGNAADVRFSPRERQRLDTAWRVLRTRPFNGTCLRRALLAARILRRRDHAVRIGVRKIDGRIAAHAWLELDGISLDPDAVETFAVLAPASTVTP